MFSEFRMSFPALPDWRFSSFSLLIPKRRVKTKGYGSSRMNYIIQTHFEEISCLERRTKKKQINKRISLESTHDYCQVEGRAQSWKNRYDRIKLRLALVKDGFKHPIDRAIIRPHKRVSTTARGLRFVPLSASGPSNSHVSLQRMFHHP